MNWGNKLLLTFIVFAGGMAFLVYKSMQTNFELVEKDYYKSELKYQDVIDGTNRANLLSKPVSVQQTTDGLTLSLPSEMKNRQVKGTVWFYCSYDQTRDRKLILQTDSTGKQYFEAELLQPGSYKVKVNWQCEAIDYFSEQNLLVY